LDIKELKEVQLWLPSFALVNNMEISKIIMLLAKKSKVPVQRIPMLDVSFVDVFSKYSKAQEYDTQDLV
jgi:hypothetical protein